MNKIPFVHSQNNFSTGGLVSQLTECRWNGITFFVREGISGINSFLISSNERWGDKAGSRPSKQRQVLELFAPAQYWHSIKELVEEADGLQRRVYFNKKFSQKFIDKCKYQKRDFI